MLCSFSFFVAFRKHNCRIVLYEWSFFQVWDISQGPSIYMPLFLFDWFTSRTYASNSNLFGTLTSLSPFLNNLRDAVSIIHWLANLLIWGSFAFVSVFKPNDRKRYRRNGIIPSKSYYLRFPSNYLILDLKRMMTATNALDLFWIIFFLFILSSMWLEWYIGNDDHIKLLSTSEWTLVECRKTMRRRTRGSWIEIE